MVAAETEEAGAGAAEEVTKQVSQLSQRMLKRGIAPTLSPS